MTSSVEVLGRRRGGGVGVGGRRWAGEWGRGALIEMSAVARRMPWPAVNRLPARVRLGIRHSVGRRRSGRCADSHTALQPAGHLE